MGCVRIVRGTGIGPTALSSYDAALAAANVHQYNLLRVSSVLPAGTSVESVGTAPDLGPIGGELTVVEARKTVSRFGPGGSDGGGPNDERTNGEAPTAHTDSETRPDADALANTDRPIPCAGLGWALRTDGRGIVYEATGTDPGTVHRAIETGLRAGCSLRDLSPARADRVVLATDGTAERIETANGVLDASGSGPRRAPMNVDRPNPSGRAEGRDSDSAHGDDTERSRTDAYLTAVVLAAYGESDPIL
jgi:arginine decarboxylase